MEFLVEYGFEIKKGKGMGWKGMRKEGEQEGQNERNTGRGWAKRE